jgi:hypothetical protein
MAEKNEAKGSSSERREYFRVTDVFPITANRIQSMVGKKARVLSQYYSALRCAALAEELSDGMTNPKLVKVLCEMNAKLDLILEKLSGIREELDHVEPQEVSLSASGISFHTPDEFSLGDLVEVKMLLPLRPPTWIVLYGNISRTVMEQDGGHEVAVHFAEMEDEARNVLSYYTIKRQREIIMKQRGMGL